MTDAAGMSDAEQALVALARDLVEEISAGKALELAAGQQELTDFAEITPTGGYRYVPPPDLPRFDPWGHTMRRQHNRTHTLGPQAAELYGHGYQASAYSAMLHGNGEAAEPVRGGQRGGEIPPEGVPEGVRQALDGDWAGGDVPLQQNPQPAGPQRPPRDRYGRRRYRRRR